MNDRAAAAAPYSTKRVRDVLRVSSTVLKGLISAGFITPGRGPRNMRRFTLQDLMLLRTAHRLQEAGIKPHKILQALTILRSQLPSDASLTGLRISAVGQDVAVHRRHGQLQSPSGQYLLAFDPVPPAAGAVTALPARGQHVGQGFAASSTPTTALPQSPGSAAAHGVRPPLRPADDWFGEAEACEAAGRMAEAEAAYRQALQADPSDVRAYLNLGALLCNAERSDDAVGLYTQALAAVGPHPLLHFNQGVALEETADTPAALTSYRQALALDPAFADAHFNLAALLQAQGDGQGALRHLSAYRRLQSNGSAG